MTYSTVACAAIGTDCTENAITLLPSNGQLLWPHNSCFERICDSTHRRRAFLMKKCRRKFRRKHPTAYCCVKQRPTPTYQDYLIRNRCYQKKKTRTACRKTSWYWYLIQSEPEEIVTSFDSSMWVGKKYISRSYKVSKFKALQNYSHVLLLSPECEERVHSVCGFRNRYSINFLTQNLRKFYSDVVGV
jgi:hypothetical protein